MISIIKEIENETIKAGKTTEDISWVGSDNGKYAMPYSDFYKRYKGVKYDDGYGGNELARDLVVVYKDETWLSRWEYDGAEGYTYNKPPKQDSNSKYINKIGMVEQTEDSMYDVDLRSNIK